MDILKELQLFDDAPNDVEINTLLGQRALTLHRSKSTEDLNSPEERASLDIYRTTFPTSAVFTGASTSVSGDTHGGIRAAGVLFTTVDTPLPEVDLSSVSQEMPMCLLQEDEGNEEELIRLLSGQDKEEWLLQAACAGQGTVKDSVGSTWCSEADDSLLGNSGMLLPDDLHLLVNAPAMSVLGFHQGPVGEMSAMEADVDHQTKAPSVTKAAALQADHLLQVLASHIPGSEAVARDIVQTVTTSVASECELSAVLEATGVPMLSSSFPSPKASGTPPLSPLAPSHHTADMQRSRSVPPLLHYHALSLPSLSTPSSPQPLTSARTTAPHPQSSSHLALLCTSPQQSVAGCASHPQTVPPPHDLTGALNVNLWNDILAAAVALCTPTTQPAVQPAHVESQTTHPQLPAEIRQTTTGAGSAAPSRQTNAASLTSTNTNSSRLTTLTGLAPSRQASTTSLAPTKPTSLAPTKPTSLAPTKPTSLAPTKPTSLAPIKPTSLAPTKPTSLAPTKPTSLAPTKPTSLAPTKPTSLAPTKPTSLGISGTVASSTRHSSLSVREPGSERVTLKSPSCPTSGKSPNPSVPSPLHDCPREQQSNTTAVRQHGTPVSSSAPCTPIAPTPEGDDITPPARSAPAVGGISLCFPVVDWTSRTVQERVFSMSATPIKLMSSESPTLEGDTASAMKSKRRHSGGWRKGKKRKIMSILPPKPPVTAYGIFLSEHRANLTKELGTLSMSSLSKQLGVMWSALDDESRLEYQKKADGDRQRYLHELKTYLREVHQATAEDHIGTLELYVSENVSQEEDDDLLFCQICKLTFASLHNKRTHYSGKLHMDALLQCIKEAMTNRAESQTAKPETHQSTVPDSQQGEGSNQNGSKSNELQSDKFSDQLKGSGTQIDCSDSQFSTTDCQLEAGNSQTATPNSQASCTNKLDCNPGASHSDTQLGSVDCGQPMVEDKGKAITGDCEKRQGQCDSNDPCRQQSNAADSQSIQTGVHRSLGRRRQSQKKVSLVPVSEPSMVCSNNQHSTSDQGMQCLTSHSVRGEVPCADVRQAPECALQRVVAPEHLLQQGAGCVELYSTISKQMADFAITYSCCVNTKGDVNASPGYMLPNDHHGNNLAALRERAARLKDSITHLLKSLDNVQ